MKKQPKVVNVPNEYTIVINIGSDSGIQPGQRYMLYSLSPEEIIDPDTNESLGYLEIVKGTGKVTNVQEKMSTIKSDTCQTSSKKITRKSSYRISILDPVEEVETNPELLPFEYPEIGDLVKRIN